MSATSEAQATAKCDAIAPGAATSGQINSLYLSVPDGIWRCTILGV